MNKTQIIKGDKFELLEYADNSAPCNKCYFFNFGTLQCGFPKDEEKQCRMNAGTHKGWNTLEYKLKSNI